MKKILIFAGALLFAAVFMSGCITETPSDDPIVGIWYNGEDMSTPDGLVLDSNACVFKADGTGYSLTGFGGELVYGKIDFTWKNTGDGKYLLTAVDTKEDGIPQDMEYILSGDTLAPVDDMGVTQHRATVEEYAVGLWTGVRTDYKEYTDIQVLLYLGADGKGNAVVYGPDVLNLDEIFTSEFTWKAEDDKVILTGGKGVSAELPLVNGELIFSGLYPLHKYTVEDNLYGLWESAELYVEDGVSYDIVEVIRSDGTGVEIWTVPGSDKTSFRYTFTWEMTSSTTYKAVYDDGDVWLFESINTQLFDGETWYNKVGFDVLQDYAQSKVTA